MKKPSCFSEEQWETYQKELEPKKNGKQLDVCIDCTIQFQKEMRKLGKCDFPMKRIDKVQEFV